jgi:hypothetical protein
METEMHLMCQGMCAVCVSDPEIHLGIQRKINV